MKKKGKIILAVLVLLLSILTGCGKETGRPDVKQPETGQWETQQQEEGQPEEEQQEEEQSETGRQEEGQQEEEQPEAGRQEEGQQEEEQSEAGRQEEKQPESGQPAIDQLAQENASVQEEGKYTSKEEVAAYLHLFGHLPDNFITKAEARELGWVSSEGNLGEVAPGKSIGGDYFGNYEGILPEKDGREYHECDIDSNGGYRGAKRIVYSNDGLIYYTQDHYETFELLYGEE